MGVAELGLERGDAPPAGLGLFSLRRQLLLEVEDCVVAPNKERDRVCVPGKWGFMSEGEEWERGVGKKGTDQRATSSLCLDLRSATSAGVQGMNTGNKDHW